MRKGMPIRKEKPANAAVEALCNVRAMESLFITPEVASQVLECDPQLIRVQAKQCPALLGFPTTAVGTRIKIPRIPFIRYIVGEVQTTTNEVTHATPLCD